MADSLRDEAAIYSHSLLNDVNTRVSVSGLTHTILLERSGLAPSTFRAILHNDIDIPIQDWMMFVLSANPTSVDKYCRDAFANNSQNILVMGREVPKATKTWLNAVATDINSALKASESDISSEIHFPELLQKGHNASFFEWAKAAIQVHSTNGLDSGHLEIISLEYKQMLKRLWDSTI